MGGSFGMVCKTFHIHKLRVEDTFHLEGLSVLGCLTSRLLNN